MAVDVRTITGRDPMTGSSLQVHIRDGRIERLRTTDHTSDQWISPGLVDLQVNGFAGHDLNTPEVDPKTVIDMVHSLRRRGVTTVVPTVITAAEEQIALTLRAIAEARASDRAIAHAIPCVHVEGPFLSDQDGPRGAHDRRHIRAPSVAELERWQRVCGGLVGIVTVSPHSERALDFIAAATRHGVRCAIGHTHATPDQIVRAVDVGARLATHLGNGAHAVLPRHPNYLWAQLADDRLAAGFIADGHHLPADTLRAMLRAKGLARSYLVSDAMGLAGLPAGQYRLADGQQVELSETGRLSLTGTPFLAGAVRSLADGVVFAVAAANIALGVGLALATVNPGRILGDRGTLAPGQPADLIAFRWEPTADTLDIRAVIAAGVPVSEAPDS